MNNLFEKKSVSSGLCNSMIEKAFEKAGALNIGISVSIVDESGVAKSFARMDNAPLISVDASRKKAITAVGFGMPTGEPWYNFIKDDPILLHGVSGITDFSLLGGGSPIVIEDQVVGAIGISGSHYKNDEECTKAALGVLVK